MKKYLSLVVAVLMVMASFGAYADAVPMGTDAQNYPVVWTASVYNGSSSDIGTCTIVQWDFDTSDSGADSAFDDKCPWVKTADAAGDIWTAGVTLANKGISAGEAGTIIIRGPAEVHITAGGSVTADDIVETDASGRVQDHDGAAVDEGTLGVAIKQNSTIPGLTGCAIVYINPTQYDKD